MYPIAHDELSALCPADAPGGPGRLTPERAFDLAGSLVPWFASSAAIFGLAGLYIGLFAAPADAQQGQVYRIMYLHLPAAWISLSIAAAVMALAVAGLARGSRLPFQLAEALVPTGALMAFVALWSGCLWGKHTWGAWWVWDTRLIFELTLWLLYCAMIAVRAVVDNRAVADGMTAVLALGAGLAAVISHFSGQWLTALHQRPSIGLFVPALAHETMLRGVIFMALGVGAYALAAAMARLRCVILESELDSSWVALRRRAGR